MAEIVPQSPRVQLNGLRPEEYEHPQDRKTLNALEGTPGLESLVQAFNQYGIELFVRLQCTGSNIKVGPRMFPEVHKILLSVCETIHLKPVPELYIMEEDKLNALTVGSKNPIIVLNNKTVDCMTQAELEFIIGHEGGHIKSQHLLYHMMASFLFPYLGELVSQATLGVGGLVTTPIQMALIAWQRKSEYTADRAGLLACQDIDAAITAFMKMAGAPESHYDDLDPAAFLEQAKEFRGYDEDNLNKIAKILSHLDKSHPWTVKRCAELDNWIEVGAYQKILDNRGKTVSQIFLSCERCGKTLQNGAKFCNKCGKKI